MRLLHTADWHLGKTLMNRSLIEDQEFILDEICKLANPKEIDAIIIAGDVYDRADPSPEAVDLFDEILFKLTEKKIPVLCIAGNHDNAERLNFGSRLFANKKFFITTKTALEPKTIALDDDFGAVYFSLIPYFEPAAIREKFFDKDSERLTFNAANRFYIGEARKKIPAGKRSVAIAHVFVEGGEESPESERKIVGTAGKVDAQIFSGYDYAALGHLHKPHVPEDAPENVRYAGSPLKYSAREAKHEKGVTIVELDAKGFVSAENIPLTPRRDLIDVSGTLNHFLSQQPNNAYAYVTLTDETFVYDARQKLSGVFPYIMDAKNKAHSKEFVSAPARKIREEASLAEQFADFFEEMTHRALTDDERAAVAEICGG